MIVIMHFYTKKPRYFRQHGFAGLAKNPFHQYEKDEKALSMIAQIAAKWESWRKEDVVGVNTGAHHRRVQSERTAPVKQI